MGEYGADRKGGTKKHSGADITTRLTTTDPMAYAVFAVAEGVVAYAKFNGLTYDDGWGQVIILDHGNDCYSMYAHLAASPFIPWADDKAQPFMVKLGEKVTKGQHIGFFVDIDKGLDSTGNAQRTAAGARWQTHFELIEAPSGRAGSGTIKGDIFGNDGKSVDPTALLLDLGYKIEDL
ncbi:putative M23 peptidase domain protein [Rhodobacteraceae bacterium KLH11]|nr:putative M23 peptidase domain protein [Rhodobacteraceae bacterium KLH11]